MNQRESDPKAVRREINSLIKETFDIPLRGKPFEPFKFNMRYQSSFDMTFFRWNSDQDVNNACYCHLKDKCYDTFFNKASVIIKKHGVKQSGGIHYSPKKLIEEGRLDCDQFIL